MPNWVRLVLAIGAAIQVFGDIAGIVITPFPLDTGLRTVILVVILGLTLLWDLGAIVVMFIMAPATPPVGGYTEHRRRIGMYFTTGAALLTLTALAVVVLPLAIPYLGLVIALEIFFLTILTTDVVSSVFILR